MLRMMRLETLFVLALAGCAQVERHPLYRLPPPRDWPRLRALAESGAAATLFAAWAPYASPGPGHVLPEDLVRID